MLLIAALNTTGFALLGAALLLSGVLLFRSQRYFSRLAQRTSFSDALREPPADPDPAELAVSSRKAERWEVEMQETARELSARLDSKMSALQHLIRDADRAAARLERALNPAAPGSGAPAPSAGPVADQEGLAPAPDGAAAGIAGYQQRYEEIYMLADYGYPPEEIAQRVDSPIGEVQLILGLRKKH